MIERRHHPRRVLGVRLRWRVIDLEHHALVEAIDAPRMQEALSCDFSDGGVAFTVAVPVPVGAALALELERESGGPPLSALGCVARCVANADGWLVGVKLTWIEATQPERALGVQPESAWTLL